MNKIEPIFKQVLGDDWYKLGSVIQNHYFLKPWSNDYICVNGSMDEIYHSRAARLLIPFGLIFGAIVPFNKNNVPVDVHYRSRTDNANLYWDRVFKYKPGKVFHFKSYMAQYYNNEVIEFVRFGVGIRLAVSARDGALIFEDKGYVWKFFGKMIPFPGHWLFGRAYIEERPINENSFSMKMIIKHPLLGELFKYNGSFTFSRENTREALVNSG